MESLKNSKVNMPVKNVATAALIYQALCIDLNPFLLTIFFLLYNKLFMKIMVKISIEHKKIIFLSMPSSNIFKI